MNFLYCFLVATAVFASDSGVQSSRRNLWWWANEPRFIMGPPSGNNFQGPRKALANPSPHNYGSEVVLMDRDVYDRYQKFRLQDTSEGVYIRFDNHPQPGIRARDGDNKIEMYNADWDNNGEWLIVVNAIRANNRWVEPVNPLSWTAEEMSKIGRMRVVVYNKGKDAFLRIKNGQPEMIKIDIEWDEDKLKDAAWVNEQQAEWELEYVTNQFTAGAVTMMVLGPAAVAGAIGATAAGPAIAAILASYGFAAAIPAMQILGAGAVTKAKFVAVTIVAGMINKSVLGVESEVSLGDMDSSENYPNSENLKEFFKELKVVNEPSNGYGYSIINGENLMTQYGVYGLALIGLMAIGYGVYNLTCGRAKSYVEIQMQEIDEEEA